jgi:hypothetical protein
MRHNNAAVFTEVDIRFEDVRADLQGSAKSTQSVLCVVKREPSMSNNARGVSFKKSHAAPLFLV